MLQGRIEEQFRNVFRNELPMIVHKLSKVMIEDQRKKSEKEMIMKASGRSRHRTNRSGQADLSEAADARSEPTRQPSHSPERYFENTYALDGYASDGAYYPNNDNYRQSTLRRKVATRWSGNDLHMDSDLGLGRLNVLYRSLDTNMEPEEIGLRWADSKLPGVNASRQNLNSSEENEAGLEMVRELSGGYSHQLGLHHQFQQHLQSPFHYLVPAKQLAALELNNRHARGSSACSNRSMDSTISQSPSLLRQGQMNGTVWIRPDHEHSELRPLIERRNNAHIRQTGNFRQGRSMEEGRKSVLLQAPENEIAAHLASLMLAYQTITPNSYELKNLLYRGKPTSSSKCNPESSFLLNKKRVGRRYVHTIRMKNPDLNSSNDSLPR